MSEAGQFPVNRNSEPTISLCIPTMNRYDKFLSKSIPDYLTNEHITEIVICDETGEDYESILSNFSHPKLKVFKNDHQLGCFKNKMNVASKATSKYICIFDSDNFADENYFIAFKNFIKSSDKPDNTIFLPSFARPNFNYKWLCNNYVTKENVKDIWFYFKNKNLPGAGMETVLNTMNCIISKAFFDKYNILDDEPWCNECYAYDSIYFCLYYLFILNASLIVVPDMEYDHRVHDGSHYTEKAGISGRFYDLLKLRFFNDTM